MFDGGEVVANAEANRLQIIFADKPDEALRGLLKSAVSNGRHASMRGNGN